MLLTVWQVQQIPVLAWDGALGTPRKPLAHPRVAHDGITHVRPQFRHKCQHLPH